MSVGLKCHRFEAVRVMFQFILNVMGWLGKDCRHASLTGSEETRACVSIVRILLLSFIFNFVLMVHLLKNLIDQFVVFNVVIP